MTEREEVIERLRQAEIGGGSHESLSAIAKAIMPDVIYGWTRGACERLRDKLVELIGFGGTATVDGLSELPELLRKAAEGGYEGERGKVIDNVAQLIGCEPTTHSSVIKALADKVEHELRRQYNHGYDAVFASVADELADVQPPYSQLLALLRDEWHIDCSWDGLRKFWNVELTDEGVSERAERDAAIAATVGSGRAEDVIRQLIARLGDAADFHFASKYVDCIVEEYAGKLATLEAGTCYNASAYPDHFFRCSRCGKSHLRNAAFVDMPRHCPNCGRKVVSK